MSTWDTFSCSPMRSAVEFDGVMLCIKNTWHATKHKHDSPDAMLGNIAQKTDTFLCVFGNKNIPVPLYELRRSFVIRCAHMSCMKRLKLIKFICAFIECPSGCKILFLILFFFLTHICTHTYIYIRVCAQPFTHTYIWITFCRFVKFRVWAIQLDCFFKGGYP